MLRRLIFYRPSRGGLILLVILLPAAILLSFHQQQSSSPPAFVLQHPYFQYDLDLLDPRTTDDDSRQWCAMPRIHPFDPSIWGFLEPGKGIACAARKPELTVVDEDGRLRFNGSQLDESGYVVGKSIQCSWRRVERGGSSPEEVDNVVSYGEESPLPREGVLLPPDVEVLRVACRNFAGLSVYDRLHARIRDLRPAAPPPGIARNFVNVLIFGVDSLSRLAFIRHLPITYRYLTEDLGMTVLRGMNKVGDNTYPNLIALLTGKAAYGGDLPDSSQGFDDWPLIWKNFSRLGYATMWAEDYPDFGLFSYLAAGFREPPTMHYLRPFWLAMKDSPLLKISSHMCYGARPRFLSQVDYLRQFISVYGTKGVPYFGFSFLAELSHEYVSRISAADVYFRDFFQWLADSGQLDNTLLVVMSDHGHRFNSIRASRVGHIEERTPFYAVRIPMTLTSRQPKILANLLSNSGRLATPFDMYATLADLLEFVTRGRPLGISPSPPGILGLSLFGQIPADRTCKNASVPDHYCACETAAAIDKSDPRVDSATRVVVEYVNILLKDVSDKCSKLSVSNVISAELVRTMEDLENGDDGSEQKVRVVVEAEPGSAMFEATVVVRGENGGEVWGDVSRINPYAGQSDCIRHAILRKYCFCSQIVSQSEKSFAYSGKGKL